MPTTRILRSVFQLCLLEVGNGYTEHSAAHVDSRRTSISTQRNWMPLYHSAISVVVLGLAATPVEAFARAGGAGGKGGTVSLVLYLILLPFIVIYSAIHSHVVNKKHRQCKELLQRLAKTDASWDPESIKRRVERMYFKVQEAWMQRDQSIAQGFMSDRLYQKHKMQTDLMRSEHRKNVLEEITLTQAKVINVSVCADDSKDGVWVYIEGSMIDYMVNDQTGKEIAGSTSKSEHFAEVWKLIRGRTGWVLDEIEQGANIFALLGATTNPLRARPPTGLGAR